MGLSNIQKNVFDRISTLTGEVVIYPNINTEPPASNHIRIDILPANTDSMGLNSLDIESGIISVRVYSTIGSGVVKAAQRAEAVLALFPRNTQLTSCRIDKTGSIASSYIDGSWLVTPVTIQYQNIT